MVPKTYDPDSESERAAPLPSAPLRILAPQIVLQPPLTRRGSGPGVILFLPDTLKVKQKTGPKPLDPEPVQKWAEEGFAVVAVTASSSKIDVLTPTIKQAISALLELDQLDIRDKFSVIVYDDDPQLFLALAGLKGLPIACLIGYGISPTLDSAPPQVPTLLHLIGKHTPIENATIHTYPAQSNYFVLPQALGYEPGSAALAHTRSLVFLRKWLGGPNFDLEAIWDEHCYFEFEIRSVAKTMATMVQEPYVNHVPTMTGGIGRAALTAFYRDHFIFSNPDDASLQVVSRTIGADRIIDEFIYQITHDRVVDWLLPGVPPTGKKLVIPMMAVVNVRGDRLYNEHIWWDQATALYQAGILPALLPHSPLDGTVGLLRLPVAGVECAHMLLDEMSGRNNEMLGSGWGMQK